MIQLVVTFVIALIIVSAISGGFDKIDESSLILIPFLMLYEFAVILLLNHHYLGDDETFWIVIVCRCIVYPPLILIVIIVLGVMVRAIWDTIKEIKKEREEDVQRIALELAMKKIKEAKIKAKRERKEKRAMIKKQLIESGLFYEYDPWEILEEDDEDFDCDNII